MSLPLNCFHQQIRTIIIDLRLKNLQQGKLQKDGWSIVVAEHPTITNLFIIFKYHPIHHPRDDLWDFIHKNRYVIHGHY